MRCCPWLTKLAGMGLAAALAGGSVAVAAGGVTAPRGPGLPVILTALQGPQARVLNPGPPTGLTATGGAGQVTLSWQPPASDGGAAVVGYDIYLSTSSYGGSPRPVNGTLISGTSAVVTGLTDGTTYYFTVTAASQAGQGPASGAVPATPAAAISKPGSPNELTASPGNGRVTLSWRAPASGGGGGISGYEIYLGTRPGGESGVPVNGTLVRTTSCTLAGLANGTTYYFTVAAVNQANRQGAASAEDSATPLPVTAASVAASSAPRPRETEAAAVGAGGTAGRVSGGPSAWSTPTPVLASVPAQGPRPVVVSLAAVAAGATAAALALTVRRLRKRRRPAAPPPVVRAVPDRGPASPVAIHEIGTGETYTVRLESRPAAIIATIEETGS